MRIGDLTKIAAGGLTLWVKWSWGQMKDLAKKFEAMPENLEAFDKLLATEVLPHVVKVEGLEDPEGVPVTELTGEVLDQLPPEVTIELLKGLQGGGLANPPAGTSGR